MERLGTLLLTPGITLEHHTDGMVKHGPHGEQRFGSAPVENDGYSRATGPTGATGVSMDPSQDCAICNEYRSHFRHAQNNCTTCAEHRQHLQEGTTTAHAGKLEIRYVGPTSTTVLRQIQQIIQETDPTSVECRYYSMGPKKLGLKPEFQEQFDRLEAEHKIVVAAYEEKIQVISSKLEELTELGVEIDDYCLPKCPPAPIPVEWYNWEYRDDLLIYYLRDSSLDHYVQGIAI